jgi:uncharacterized membrane protein YgcG
MKTVNRMMRHLTTTTAAGRRAFPPATLQAIQAAIAEGETRHRAEVRLIVEPALSMQAVLNGTSARERALELFAHYRIWDTEENCGVLIYINLADHKVEIVADRAIGRLISAKDWQTICRTMTKEFARGAFHDSVLAALDQMHALLQTHFPDDGSRSNQLSDRPIVL